MVTRSRPLNASPHRLVGSTEALAGPVDSVAVADVALKTGTGDRADREALAGRIVDPGRVAAQEDSLATGWVKAEPR